MSQLYSPEYKALQEQFHRDRPDYGCSGRRYADQVMGLAQHLNTRDILDYACGKATLQKSIPFPIQNFDPFVEEYSRRPVPADLVVNTDCLEHIELTCLNSVLEDIRALTKQAVFFQIATGPAKKTLPDGRNAHLIQENGNWWLEKLIVYFNIRQFQDLGNGLIAICTPITKDE